MMTESKWRQFFAGFNNDPALVARAVAYLAGNGVVDPPAVRAACVAMSADPVPRAIIWEITGDDQWLMTHQVYARDVPVLEREESVIL